MSKKVHPLLVQLRRIRKSRNMSQVELSKKIGVTAHTLCFWENGNHAPSWFAVTCWAESLGVDIVVKDKTP